MKRCGIYTITNTITNKVYVGSTTRLFSQRWGDHRVGLRSNTHVNIHLQRDWNKCGEDSFKFEILEVVKSIDKVLDREQYWMDKLNVYKKGYNRTLKAGNSYGVKRTAEQRKAQGALGNWKKANEVWRGSKHSEESKQLIRAKRATQIMVFNEERNRKISDKLKISNLGNKNRMKYFNIVATKGTEVLKFSDMREAKNYFNLKTNGTIGRVIRKIRSHWHGWVFTCDE